MNWRASELCPNWSSTPSNPPSRTCTADSAKCSMTSWMSSGSIAFGVSRYITSGIGDGAQTGSRERLPLHCCPLWLSCAKMRVSKVWTAPVSRLYRGSTSGRNASISRS